jgi:outer membrane protein
MVDVVRAQQSLFEAQEQLASDQYQFILSILRLKYLAGSLNVADIEEINAWLDTTRISKLRKPSKHLLAVAQH